LKELALISSGPRSKKKVTEIPPEEVDNGDSLYVARGVARYFLGKADAAAIGDLPDPPLSRVGGKTS